MEEVEVEARVYLNGSLERVVVGVEGDYVVVSYPDRIEYHRRDTIGHRITIRDDVYLVNGTMPIQEDTKRSCYPNAPCLKEHAFLHIEGLTHKDHPLVMKGKDLNTLLRVFIPRKEVDLLG